jgi:uncharacterized iron-regulated membrane protein
MSAMGLAVAMLSITGIVIWARKLRSRRLQDRRQREPAGAAPALRQGAGFSLARR